MNQDFEVAPADNPFRGLPGDRMREETLRMARRVFEFLTSEEGLRAEVMEEHRFGWKLSVDPSVVAEKTGAEFPVTEVWVRHGDGEILPFDSWDSASGESPVIVRFLGCTFFDEGSAFFEDLAKAFGVDRIAFGVEDGF